MIICYNGTMFIVELPCLPSGVTLNSRTHWRDRAQKAQDAKDEMKATVLEAGLGNVRLQRVEARYTFFMPSQRRQDIDQLHAAAKSYLDGIIELGVLPDDSWREIPQVSLHCVYRAGQPGMRLELIEMDNQ